ncbi:acyltransferase [Frankia sp. AgKG'84/4]
MPGREGGRPPRGRLPDVPEPRAAEPVPAAPAGSPSVSDAAARFAYSPALDGIRVLCIYVILAGHMGAIHASNVAVDVFFVLSGFLITALLLAEHSRTGTVSIGRFLVRRAFRLMPAMWVYLVVGLAVTVAFKWNDIAFRDDYIGSALSAFFNVNNWYKVLHPAAGGRWLAHVWSLSLEEQFYLVWPVLFLLLIRSARLRPHMIKILLGMIAILVGWTYFVASGGAPHSRVYLATDTHVAPLLIGCLVALWRDRRLRALARPQDRAPGGTDPRGHRRRRADLPAAGGSVTANVVQRWGAGRRIAALGLVAAIGLVFFAFLGPNKDGYAANWLDRAGYLPSALLAAVVILSADLRRDAAWVRLLGRPRMAFLGKITFSIYLWHYPVISAASGQLVPRIGLWPSVVCAIAASTFIAYFSNRWIEKPAQRARPKWADTPRGPARPAASAEPPLAGPIEPTPGSAAGYGTRPRPKSAENTENTENTEDTAWLTFGASRGFRTREPRAHDPRDAEPRYVDDSASRYAGVPSSRTAEPAGTAWSERRDHWHESEGAPWHSAAGSPDHARPAADYADYAAAPGSHEPPAFYDQVTDRPGDPGSYRDAWDGPGSDPEGIWVDEGYARPPVGHSSPRRQPTGPARGGWDTRADGWAGAGGSLTGPSPLPADPGYVDEAYPGELVRDAGWGHEAQRGPAEYPRREAPYPPAGGVGRNWTEQG